MLYAWDITITAGTAESKPKTQDLKVTAGVIVKVSIKFPRGCHGTAKARLFYLDSQLVPLSRGEWVTGDAESVESPYYFEIKGPPFFLKFKGCSPDSGYDHTVTVRISMLPRAVASWLPVVEILTRLLSRLGVR